MYRAHNEHHKSQKVGWLRAAVMGANDGVVSTAALILGVAASGSSETAILLAGSSGLVAGAMSMAAGEYVSVSSQADTQKADVEQEKEALKDNPKEEFEELAEIYKERGLDDQLSKEVAQQLMNKDALRTHMRDEIGITEVAGASPLSAAGSSALAFVVGAGLPLFSVWLSPAEYTQVAVAIFSVIFLMILGGMAAYTGGANIVKGTLRVTFWGCMAMIVTTGIGKLF
ncbi:MAG: VIT family protein [Halofilum sp. (in: g-proteobacteria)]|nr:VIT family protein [Halofilum sp. (in: g-proteobacteria)]